VGINAPVAITIVVENFVNDLTHIFTKFNYNGCRIVSKSMIENAWKTHPCLMDYMFKFRPGIYRADEYI